MFLTGQSESDSVQGFSMGAVDYITKPFSIIEVKLRIKTYHDLYKSRFELKQYAEHMEALANERAEQLTFRLPCNSWYNGSRNTTKLTILRHLFSTYN